MADGNSNSANTSITGDESAGEPSIPGSNRPGLRLPQQRQQQQQQLTENVASFPPSPLGGSSSSDDDDDGGSSLDGHSSSLPESRAASGPEARAWSDELPDTSTEDEDEDHRRLEAEAEADAGFYGRAMALTDAPRATQSSRTVPLMASMAKKGALKQVEPSAMAAGSAPGKATKQSLLVDKKSVTKNNVTGYGTGIHGDANDTTTQWKSNVAKWHDADAENVLTPRGSKRVKQLPRQHKPQSGPLATSAKTNTPSALRGAQPLLGMPRSGSDHGHELDNTTTAMSVAIQMDSLSLPPPRSRTPFKPSTSLNSSTMRLMERSPLLRPLSSIQDDPEWGFRATYEVKPDLKTEFLSLCTLSYPVIFTYVLEFLPGIVSMALVGHMDSPKVKEYVDGVALSTMFMNLTGIAFGFGLATAMDTLCSQAYGAGKPLKMGIYFQCGLLVLGLALVPVVLLNWYTEQFLLWMGQPVEVAAFAGRFSRLVLPGIPFLYIYELVKKLLQAQNVVTPMVYIAVLSNVVNVVLGVYLTWYTPLGYDGAAIARTVANVVLPGALVPLFLWNPEIAKTWWPGWKLAQAMRHMTLFLTLGIPGMFMMLLEWWAFEIMAAFIGLLPDSVVAISVHSVLSTVSSMAFNVFLGIGVATNIRVGNYVGSNQPDHAKMASACGMALSLAVSAALALAIFATRNVLPVLLINDATSVALAAHAFLVLMPYQMIDSINSVMQGVFRGTGRQSLGAYINLFGYFGVGLPFGVYLAFTWNLGVEGLWLGLTSGVAVGATISLYKIYYIDWDEMADAARLRSS